LSAGCGQLLPPEFSGGGDQHGPLERSGIMPMKQGADGGLVVHRHPSALETALRIAVHFWPALTVISRATSRTNRSNSGVPGFASGPRMHEFREAVVA
jgi:hypothetical protein